MKAWITAIIALVAGTAGAVEYFASAHDLELVAGRLEQKIKADERYQTQQRLWQLEDRNHARNCEDYRIEADKCECRMLKLRLEILKQELEKGYK